MHRAYAYRLSAERDQMPGSLNLSLIVVMTRGASEQLSYKDVNDVRVAFARVRQAARCRPLV